MKQKISKQAGMAEDMRSGYNFADLVGGVRGKYYRAYRTGHTVKIHRADGITSVQRFTLEDGDVMLESDVREYFPDLEAVNSALRVLIALVPTKHRASAQ